MLPRPTRRNVTWLLVNISVYPQHLAIGHSLGDSKSQLAKRRSHRTVKNYRRRADVPRWSHLLMKIVVDPSITTNLRKPTGTVNQPNACNDGPNGERGLDGDLTRRPISYTVHTTTCTGEYGLRIAVHQAGSLLGKGKKF